MSLSHAKINKLLASIPGARKAYQGIIFPIDEHNFPPQELFPEEKFTGCILGERFGDEFHLRNLFTEKDLEGLLEGETFYLEFCSKKEIFQLRDIKGPSEYLLRLRAEAVADYPRVIRVMASRREHYERNGRVWSLSNYYHLKDNFHKSYISLLTKDNRNKVKHIPSGLAYIPDVNALCIRSIVGDVVLVSESLEKFYYFMSIAFYGEQFGLNLIIVRNALTIAIRIMTGAETFDFDIDPRGVLPAKAEKMLKNLVSWQMQFTFGHEYSHYLCGHLKEAETINYSYREKSGKSPTEIAMYNHNLEYEADYYSLKNIIHNKKEFGNIAHGAFSTLIYLHFLEKCSCILPLKKVSISETHPNALDRLNNLHKKLSTKSPINHNVIEGMLNKSDNLLALIKESVKDQRKDIFTFHGSIYLSGSEKKPAKDRVDY
ncbi:hypothetical protein [Vibrio atlanticus]|uniref:hypothetical protein n=1 Tax=Vibrio atlanticus TaxID=693153 RepID=UPI0022AFE793|nr:hypothetical protein [Vibrio atlanticus]MCZ4308167.1 hypothetical protein [Vibrio atlanticus]